jgi:amino acid adenylation domain-containing protein
LIGFFVNTLGLRGEVRERESVREMLRREREVCLGGYGAQEVPFEKVVEEMEPERSLTHSPIFQAMLVYQNAPVPTMKLPGLTLTVLEFSPGVSKADISLLSVDDGDNLSCLLEYSTDLFDDVTMARMAGHLETLLRAIAANPEQRVGELSMLTEAERRQILVEWNDTSAPYPKERCVHQVFEAHAARNPNAPALEDRDGQLTYGELNRRANRLAHYLRARGVGPDVPVGLCLERSPAWVTGVLGILKAGGAYVSLDPTYPKERLAVMMEDARVPILVTMRRWLADSLIPKQMQTICLDDDWEEIEAESEQNPESGVTPQNLAYIVYTSGSTGRPKGVTTTHGSLLNLVCWHNRAFEVTSADRAGQVARMGFDASVLEMWPIFNAGASLHLIDEETRLSPEKIKQWLVDNRITFSFLPPALSESILFEDWPENTSLRIMTSGSDRLLHCPPESLRFKYVNQYGPTEATVIVTTCEVQPQTQERAAPHIGRPLANTQIYLLNSFMQPVAVGLTGELYIGGDSLARGYLHDPKLTAEKFVPNPFSPRPGARLYRTGDLARYLPGGEIEFLGRADEQVKVRGFRIELGEVRSVLLQHPAVETGIVIVREDTPGDKRLVAYLVFREQPAPTAEELRAFLRVQLPEYMLPTAFMALDRLPLTPNSKVDLRMLPAPDWGRPDMEGSTALPRTPLEASLAEIFADVLGVVSVGVHQNFFSLGGHSLLATHLLTRVRDALRIDLPLRNLFEGPTVAELAAAIEAHMPAADLPAPPEVEVIARGDKSLDDLLAELNAMSEEEADALMADERRLNN